MELDRYWVIQLSTVPRACLESGLVEPVYIVFAAKETALEFRHSMQDYPAIGKRSWLRTWAVWCP